MVKITSKPRPHGMRSLLRSILGHTVIKRCYNECKCVFLTSQYEQPHCWRHSIPVPVLPHTGQQWETPPLTQQTDNQVSMKFDMRVSKSNSVFILLHSTLASRNNNLRSPYTLKKKHENILEFEWHK